MEQPITFHFDTAQAAGQAADTLQELGYKTKTALNIYIDRGDLTSALEIAQAFGGEISVHSYTDETLSYHAVPEAEPTAEEGEPGSFDPSEEDYNQFSAGIHL